MFYSYQAIESPLEECDLCVKTRCEKKDGMFCWEIEEEIDYIQELEDAYLDKNDKKFFDNLRALENHIDELKEEK